MHAPAGIRSYDDIKQALVDSFVYGGGNPPFIRDEPEPLDAGKSDLIQAIHSTPISQDLYFQQVTLLTDKYQIAPSFWPIGKLLDQQNAQVIQCIYKHNDSFVPFEFWTGDVPSIAPGIVLGDSPFRPLGLTSISACPGNYAGAVATRHRNLGAKPRKGSVSDAEHVVSRLTPVDPENILENGSSIERIADPDLRSLTEQVAAGGYSLIECAYVKDADPRPNYQSFWYERAPKEAARLGNKVRGVAYAVGVTAIDECPSSFQEGTKILSKSRVPVFAYRPPRK